MINFNRIEVHKEFLGISEADGFKYQLLVDGFIINGVTVGEKGKKDLDLATFYILSENPDFFLRLEELKYVDFYQSRIEEIRLYNWAKWESLDVSVGIIPSYYRNDEHIFEIEFRPDLVNWNYIYSFNDYYELFNQFWEIDCAKDRFDYLRRNDKEHTFQLKIDTKLNGLPLAEEVNKKLIVFNEIHQKTVSQLNDKYIENSVLASFNFPVNLKSPCKQYLMYFAQFLQDIGINTNSNLEEEAGKILFSVTPIDETQALDKIREALAVYLNLPNSPIVFDDSFAAMRLQQQIENLQHSQKMAVRELQFNEKLLTAQSDMLHEKNLTISQLQTINEQQQKIIEKISSKSVMTDSLENKEKLYEGLEFVPSEALKKYAGVIFQPVSFFKELGKNILGKDEFTSLDLDKEVEK